jgi:hypothetical protein
MKRRSDNRLQNIFKGSLFTNTSLSDFKLSSINLLIYCIRIILKYILDYYISLF